MRLIDADVYLARLERMQTGLEKTAKKYHSEVVKESASTVGTCIYHLNRQPTLVCRNNQILVDDGKWIHVIVKHCSGEKWDEYECSQCHTLFKEKGDTCPNCGAHMIGGCK